MDDYNRYVTAVNKIFDYLEKMKAGWNNTDNKNYIDTIDEFKGVVTSKADEFKKPPTVQLEKTSAELEAEQEAALEEEQKAREESRQVEDTAPAPTDPPKAEQIPEIPVTEIPTSFSSSIPGADQVEALGE